ncbi:MAG: BatA domain-containing protein [Chitinophagaceae bacterium]|nr:BatA domain-containing protein [Chitinophagaceae bacterium]
MNVLFPIFLTTALLIAIPVIIHLFNFRKYKKVLFPDIRFLKELQEQAHKQSRLKNLLILTSRILAILALVLAFAQPFFLKDQAKIKQGPKAVSIYIDNSFSMGIEEQGVSLLDRAKGKARELISSYSKGDRFQILTNDFAYQENRFLTRDEALRQLGPIHVSSKTRPVATILEKQKQLLLTEPDRQQQLIFISDFQKNNFPSELSGTDSIRKYFLLIPANQKNNLSIDTAYFETPSLLMNEPNLLTVRINNFGSEEVSTSLNLSVNDQMKSVLNVNLKPNDQKIETFNFTPSVAGIQKIKISLTDYPVSFDDTFHIAAKVNSNYNVLILNQSNANAFLSSVFKPGTQFRMDNHNVQTVQPDLVSNYSLVILNGVSTLSAAMSEALDQYLQSGGSVLVFPPSGSNLSSLNAFLQKSIGATFLNMDTAKAIVSDYSKAHPLFRDIFVKTPENIELPTVYKHFRIGGSALSSEMKLFTFSGGDAFLSVFNIQNGHLYLCASPADLTSSDFPKSYWFLPLIYKMAFMQGSNSMNALTIGKQTGIYIENKKLNDKTIYHMIGNGVEAIPEQRTIGSQVRININQSADKAGFYSIYLPGSKDSVFTGVNYDRAESALAYWPLSELKNKFKLKNLEWIDASINAAAGINELQHGIPLWKVCITLALLFLLIEILLIRFMK